MARSLPSLPRCLSLLLLSLHFDPLMQHLNHQHAQVCGRDGTPARWTPNTVLNANIIQYSAQSCTWPRPQRRSGSTKASSRATSKILTQNQDTKGEITENQARNMAGEASSLQSRLPLPTPAMLSVKMVVSRVGDCTGRAVCELSCPFDSDALRKPHTLRQPCLNCLVAFRSQPSTPLLPATSTSSTSWALPQLVRMTSRASLQYASMSPPGPHASRPALILARG